MEDMVNNPQDGLQQSGPSSFMLTILCIMVVIIGAGGIFAAWLHFDTKSKRLDKETADLKAAYTEEIDGIKSKLYKSIWKITCMVEQLDALNTDRERIAADRERIAKEAAEAKTQYIFKNQILKTRIEEMSVHKSPFALLRWWARAHMYENEEWLLDSLNPGHPFHGKHGSGASKVSLFGKEPEKDGGRMLEIIPASLKFADFDNATCEVKMSFPQKDEEPLKITVALTRVNGYWYIKDQGF